MFSEKLQINIGFPWLVDLRSFGFSSGDRSIMTKCRCHANHVNLTNGNRQGSHASRFTSTNINVNSLRRTRESCTEGKQL